MGVNFDYFTSTSLVQSLLCDLNAAISNGPLQNRTRATRYRIVVLTRSHFRPTANKLDAERTYITPSDSAGVAISNSPIELVAMWLNFSPAEITSISPSSFER